MAIDSQVSRILLAAIPVMAMLLTEVVLSRRRKRGRVGSSRQAEPGRKPRRDAAPAESAAPATSVAPAESAASTSRRRQDDRYFQTLYQAARTGSLSAMNKLGEFAFVRRNFVEAFYWKLMLEMRHGRLSGLPAQGVCRLWQDIGFPESDAADGGSLTESQFRLAMAILDLWSGRHVHTPKETIRAMVEGGDKDALLYAKRFGIGHARS